MRIDRDTLVFFDASCLIAAAGSPTGGSGFLLSLCARRLLRGAISHIVLLEAEHNIQAKLSPLVLSHFHELLQVVPLVVAPVPPRSSEKGWTQHVNAKDVHIVCATLSIECDYLLTLDQNLVEEISHTAFAMDAISPRDFIRTILPSHEEIAKVRT